MKQLYITVFLLFAIQTGYTQSFSGDWEGELPNIKLKTVFHITNTGTGYKTTMDSPQQGAFNIPIKETRVAGDSIYINYPEAGLAVEGKLIDGDSIKATFYQGTLQLPLILSRFVPKRPERPQEPKEPFDYYTEDVQFENTADRVQLAGTLTLPGKTGNFPAVILISGSGPENRDSEVFEHKPFLVLANHLTKNGIAVLRYDDRGTAESTGNYATADLEDFKRDAAAALDYLRTREEVNSKELGVIGHSEGGLLASMLAAEDRSIAFAVLLAAPGVPGDEMMIAQKKAVHKAMGQVEESFSGEVSLIQGAYDLIERTPEEQVENALRKYLKQKGIGNEKALNHFMKQLNNTEIKALIKSDPAKYLQKINCPVLALNGSKDVQVVADLNLNGIKTALKNAGNTSIKTEKLEGLNHLFQEDSTGTGLPKNYHTISETFSPRALNIISEWINQLKL